MKKFSLMLFLLLFVLVLPEHGHAAAANSKIYLDGKEITAGQKVPVENVNDTIMVPLRLISESLGYTVGWDQKSKTVTIEQQGKVIKLIVNQKTASVDDKTVQLTTAPVLRSDTTLVPIRFISEQFGLTVTWDNAKKIVYLITPGSSNENGSSDGNSGNGGSEVVPPVDPTKNLTMINGLSFSENRLSIAMEGNSAPKVSVMTGPDRLVIDFPNATFSDLFGTGQVLDPDLNGKLEVKDYPDVSGVRYSLYSSNPYTVRFVIDLNYPKNYNISVSGTDSKLVIIDLNAESTDDTSTQPGNDGKKLVVLDAGHGAKDSGAVGVTGKYEKNFNLAIVLKTAALLKKESNIDVVLTRSDDTFLELKDRAAMANNLKADLFISVHANSSASSAASGTETYYQREASKALAKVMHKYLVEATGLSDRGVRYGNFHVIRETKMPAVLLEVGYLSNKKDETLLFTEALQNKVAASIVSGIKEYLGIK
ncbi:MULTISPECIES: N-acetylmuramoyl-L-alanine amidase [Paenibacillus]|uniref:N-acetylmuramoyl-L-alanine amidase n=1 Tax=Paenibacillus TaxID=44249 RepID=UPI0004F8C8CA|nr:N-acetylmuramoyl-L-alanine amidase [Paenibacillus odorifer]AIQ75416.1 N-acetylmuramoyl-L-alanine amidase [Paenibacillus odorifer]MEC0132561.1 N-acetylmuramoyl-L-alanine amidase [Paenibacillus odorifer]MEC0224688.1 N-acetylmuramoyl-L-alanine amidase [Paenibacillus odorifer]OMC97403.1 N-acetylmuramoyl-L-alanine amidase [Paenibacillus odorifer]OMD01528.1 N-acetylmuramoyl-L-alanine amidase [Paenibacillus odorifer]